MKTPHQTMNDSEYNAGARASCTRVPHSSFLLRIMKVLDPHNDAIRQLLDWAKTPRVVA